MSSPEAAYQRGCLLRSQHRTDDAIRAFKQVLEQHPNHAQSFIQLALCWTEKEDHSAQAVDAARRAVGLEPEDAFARAVLALTLNQAAKDGQKAKIREARTIAVEATRLDPDEEAAHAILASIHLRLEEYPAAESAARRALVADHKMSMLLIRALQHRKGARAAIRVAGLTPWTRKNFARWLFEDEPRAVALTPRRWHRRFLNRDGAYVPR